MTKSVTVEFETQKQGELPRVGCRKTVRVNGRNEILWCRKVTVTANKHDPGEVWFTGTATYTDTFWY